MYGLSRAILLFTLVCLMPDTVWAGATLRPITEIEVPVVDVQVPQSLLAELQPPPLQQPQLQHKEDSGKRVASADIKCDVDGTSHEVTCY